MRSLLLSLCALAVAVPASAQTGNPRESYNLIVANVAGSDQNANGSFTAAATVRVYGGNYVFSQVCSAYGTAALQVLGPDGAYQTVTSKTAADTTGGTAVALGAGATVRATVSGTTGCAAVLVRVPA